MRWFNEEVRKRIGVDLNIKFGAPCLRGTRIPTWVIREQCEVGRTIADVAEDYSVSSWDVLAALEYEYAVKPDQAMLFQDDTWVDWLIDRLPHRTGLRADKLRRAWRRLA